MAGGAFAILLALAGAFLRSARDVGDLVVGVWVGRDDNKSLGKVTGGTAPGDTVSEAIFAAVEAVRGLSVAVIGPRLSGKVERSGFD